jgi:hypothetical protein
VRRKAIANDSVVYIVVNDFGQKLGRAYVETGEAEADEMTVVSNILSGEYSNPVRVVAFNIAEGWSSDVLRTLRVPCRSLRTLNVMPANLHSRLSRGLAARQRQVRWLDLNSAAGTK